MARPFHYNLIDEAELLNKTVRVVGTDVLYGIKKGDEWIVIHEKHNRGGGTIINKYKQLVCSTRKMAQNQADRLNDVFDTDEYRVCSMFSDD